eukprot:TRINITY_DN526_c0_g1_i1.p1 TRINITY_DN526_c0_g1~~TRINITY_DN526_c0_g1_i1.p1  ORF type:complete len:421 (-),score=21.74 TRINITY_DN526_c0_g1_i1:286-1512(-)
MFWNDQLNGPAYAPPMSYRAPTPTFDYGYIPEHYGPTYGIDEYPAYDPYRSVTPGPFGPQAGYAALPPPAFQDYERPPSRRSFTERERYIDADALLSKYPAAPPSVTPSRRSKSPKLRPPRFTPKNGDWETASDAPSSTTGWRRRARSVSGGPTGNSLKYNALHPRSAYRHPRDMEIASESGSESAGASPKRPAAPGSIRLSAAALQQANRANAGVSKPLYDPHDNDAASQISRGTVKTTSTWRPPKYDEDGRPIKITRKMKRQMSLGVRNGKLASIHPRSRPRAVSSQVSPTDKNHRVEPLPLTVDVHEAMKRLKKAIKRIPNANLVREDTDYLHYEIPAGTLIFVIDDLEIYVDKVDRLIHVRSAARLGPDDKGRNRNRVYKIWSMYQQSLERLPPTAAYNFWQAE